MKRKPLSVLMIGAMAASMMPAMHARISGPVIVQAARQGNRAPVSPAPLPVSRSSLLVIPDLLGGGGHFQMTQFYRGVPRFRGYRNGRPRGRRSYRSHQR